MARRWCWLRFAFDGGKPEGGGQHDELARVTLQKELTRTLRGFEVPAMPYATEGDSRKPKHTRGGAGWRPALFARRGKRAAGGEPVWLLPFVLGAVLLLSALPLIRLVWAGLGGLVEGEAARVLFEPATFAALGNTLLTAAGGMAISLVLGAFFAFTMALTDIR